MQSFLKNWCNVPILLIQLLLISLVLITAACAQAATPIASPEAKPSNLSLPSQPPKPQIVEVEMIVYLNVARNTSAHDQFAFYPYPVSPMKRSSVSELSTEVADLRRDMKEMIAYKQGRSSDFHLDWRIERAYKQTVDRFPANPFGTQAQIYTWLDQALPYFKKTVQAINTSEKARLEHYKSIATQADRYRLAIARGDIIIALSPIMLPVQQIRPGLRQGRAFVPGSTTWWVVGKHSVPGLTYYWEEPITLDNSDPRCLTFNEDNALLIENNSEQPEQRDR